MEPRQLQQHLNTVKDTDGAEIEVRLASGKTYVYRNSILATRVNRSTGYVVVVFDNPDGGVREHSINPSMIESMEVEQTRDESAYTKEQTQLRGRGMDVSFTPHVNTRNAMTDKKVYALGQKEPAATIKIPEKAEEKLIETVKKKLGGGDSD